MGVLFLPLSYTANVRGIDLDPVSGNSELIVEDESTRTAIAFLESLLSGVQSADDLLAFCAADIVTADRDRILAKLYIQLYGDRIAGTIQCSGCKNAFDLDFSLSGLLAQFAPQPMQVDKDGTIRIDDTMQFRLPTGADELLIETSDAAKAETLLLRQCVTKQDSELTADAIQEKMSQVAPLLHLEMHAVCPECELTQSLQFDMQQYFLRRMKQERPILFRDVHLLASHYHWSSEAILGLPRTLRKEYVNMIEKATQV